MNEPSQAYFEIELPAPIGTLSFAAAEPLLNWVRTETAYWRWLERCPRSNTVRVVQTAVDLLRSAESNCESLVKTPTGPQTRGVYQSVRNQLNEVYRLGLPHSSDPGATFTTQLAAVDPAAAAGAVALRMRPDVALDAAVVRGLVRSLLLELNVVGKADVEAVRLAKLVGEAAALTTRAEAESTAAGNQTQQLLAVLQTAVAQFRRDSLQALTEESAVHLRLRAEQKAAHEAFRDGLAEGTRLNAASSYWEALGERHRVGAIIWGSAAPLFAASVVVLAAQSLPDFFAHEAAVPAWKLGFSAACSVVALWCVGVLVRLFMTSVHGARDAAERVVMTKTYLALVREQGATPKEDREHIMKALFRPPQTGLVKDDALPPHLEVIQKIMEAKPGGR